MPSILFRTPPVHDFVIINRADLEFAIDTRVPLEENKKYYCSEIVHIHDDFIQYFMDSILWLDSINPCLKNKPIKGLAYYGYTIFDNKQAEKLQKVVQSWYDFIANAPERFELTGSWTWIHGELSETGDYEKIPVIRDKVLADFTKLIKLCEQVAENDDKFYLLHSGI